ncbi:MULTISPECIES: McrC family protein [Xanthomonas]|uniref:McrC family protein n=1 Tax=Xanthomonas sp. NCPPB 1754 TaxID=487536 RepID=UPI001E5DD3E1
MLGTIDLGRGLTIQVSPKVSSNEDWATAVVSLLTGDEGIHIAGERRAGTSRTHATLLDVLADIYLNRLERAFRQEGPIAIMERRRSELPHLQGTLDVSRWARTALWRPHIFPVSRTLLVSDNIFTQNLVFVARALAAASTQSRVSNGLRRLVRDLAPGSGPNGTSSKARAGSLPEQWSAYKPAWSLANAILNKTSLLGASGHHAGFGLAVEGWPLLETLLERTLRSLVVVAARQGRALTYQMQSKVQLLSPVGMGRAFNPSADALLLEEGRVLAAFEAKYVAFDQRVPERGHIYQALSTAAACQAPLSVLIYPAAFPHQVWDTCGFGDTPRKLVAVGLDLFKYRSPIQVESQAIELLAFLDGVDTALDSASDALVASSP